MRARCSDWPLELSSGAVGPAWVGGALKREGEGERVTDALFVVIASCHVRELLGWLLQVGAGDEDPRRRGYAT